MTKLDFVHEACATTFMSIPALTSGELTLLVNACVEAAEFRREHSKPHVEKYEAMAEQLSELSDKLDKKIDDKCGELLEEAEQKKRLSRDWDRLEKDLAEALS